MFIFTGYLSFSGNFLLVAFQISAVLCNYTCLFGNDLPLPQEGVQVALCGPHETCYLEQYVTPSGYVRHKAGCKDTMFCGRSSVLSPDIGVCSDCCFENICATNLCGNTGWPTNLGPICYHCNFDVPGPAACDTIKVCGHDDVCGVSEKPGGLFEIKCMRQAACNQLLSSSTCATCCNSTLCNSNCAKNNITPITLPAQPTPPPACTDDTNCQALYQTFQQNGQDICTTNAFKEFCNKTCGVCPGMITTTPTTPKNACSLSPCVHGTCSLLPSGAFQCTCNAGYQGFMCDKVDACVPSPCVHGICSTASNGSAVCTCKLGYVGEHCDHTDPCAISPCYNGGTCISTATGSFGCVCPLGHTGIRCDQSDPCALLQCQNGGTCSSTTSGGFLCRCTPGYTGALCDLSNTQPVNPCLAKPCVHGSCTINGTDYTCNCNQGYTRKNCDKEIHDCKDIQDEHIPRTRDDVYLALLDGNLVDIKCDMTTLGGGWTVLMNRQDNNTNFMDQDYSAYASGFGRIDGNFWTGLEKMNALTGDGRRYQLRIELTTANGSTYFETYDDFSVGPPKDFVLHVGNHNGNARDSLSGHNGIGFTTKDVDHDTNPDTNCGVYLHGAWWFHHCYDSCLTCPYITPGTINCRSFSWNSLDYCTALKGARMLVRPM